MKNFNYPYHYTLILLILIISIDKFYFSKASTFKNKTTESMNNDNSKLLKNLTKSYQEIKEMNETISSLEKENKKLKESLESANNQIKDAKSEVVSATSEPITNQNINRESEKKAAVDIKDLLYKMNEFHGFFEQMKMQMLRQKEMKKSLDSKLKEMSASEKKIFEMYKDIQSDYKSHIIDISKKVSNLESSHYEITQRLFNIQKDLNKENLEIQMNKNGIKLESEKFLKQDSNKECQTRLSCRVCVENSKCVWCGMQKRCTAGSINGPEDATCMNSFEYGTCSQSACNFLTSCISCIQNVNCGWCGSSNSCMDGGRYGSNNKTCMVNYIHSTNGKKCYNLH